MIDPKQLRIGNYITFPIGLKGKLCEVLAINEKQVLIKTEIDRRAWLNFDYLEPIPLTQELLEKCGFEYDQDDHGHYWTIDEFVVELSGIEEGIFKLEQYRTIITTLHQLQNLYFAITGDELEIKP